MTEAAIPDATATSSVVALAATGDEAAFTHLVAQHHASMARVAYGITGDRDAAADAVQSAWSIAWRRLPSMRDPASIRGWLVAIAANEARQIVRRRGNRSVLDISTLADAAAPDESHDRIDVVDLARVLRGLKPDDRLVLALRFGAGLDSGEIAAHLHLSPSGVRSRLARLLDRLREDLGHD